MLRWCVTVLGFFSLLWFLIRVIPKPSRAAYPCQRMAFPLASGFVIWLMHLTVLTVIVGKVRSLLRYRRRLGLLFCAAMVAIAVVYNIHSIAGDGSWYEPSDPALSPVGTPRGIHPGRVAWNYNPNATDWDGVTGNWHEYMDMVQVERMLSSVLTDLTGAGSDADAWDQLFRYYNQNHGKGDAGYQTNETIVIKLNLNGSTGNRQITAPEVVLALVRQLVNNAGIDDARITFYDATRDIPDVIYDLCKAEFPDVHFADLYGGSGREQVQKDLSVEIDWSDDLEAPTEIGKSGHPSYLPTCVTQADYFINLANLKGHTLGGITVCAKNHFGSFMCDPVAGGNVAQVPKSAGLHPYIAVHDFGTIGTSWGFEKRAMETYNPMVDLMGHADLGGKTVLYLIDGLYAMQSQSVTLDDAGKWQSKPFCDDDGWSSSLFASQDPVAIDSVALDFLRSEPTIQEYSGVMDAGDTVDNYLHEAAEADSPSSGTFYDPEGDAVRMASLGVHEHWNNPVERLYSGNYSPGTGIELVGPHLLPDIDFDGLPNDWERLYYGGPTNANPDALCANGHDTLLAAYIAGFDPTDPGARFSVTGQQFGATNAVYWDGVSGRVYSVYWSTNLNDGFELLRDNVHWTSNNFVDSQHQDEKALYYKLHVDLVSP
jgi:hypothetical protein